MKTLDTGMELMRRERRGHNERKV